MSISTVQQPTMHPASEKAYRFPQRDKSQSPGCALHPGLCTLTPTPNDLHHSLADVSISLHESRPETESFRRPEDRRQHLLIGRAGFEGVQPNGQTARVR